MFIAVQNKQIISILVADHAFTFQPGYVANSFKIQSLLSLSLFQPGYVANSFKIQSLLATLFMLTDGFVMVLMEFCSMHFETIF